MGILEDFYLGRIRPSEKKRNPESEYDRLAEVCENLTSEITDYIPEKERQKLRELSYAYTDMGFEYGKENFVSGFIMGMRFAAACFYENK